MTDERYRELETPGSSILTPAEFNAGWHYCQDWDFMLVQAGAPGEGEACTCNLGKTENA